MKKFKILRLLSIVTIAAAGVFGAVNFKSTKSELETETVSVNAETWTQNPTIYFVPSSQWTQNGAERFKMNYYDNANYIGYVEMSFEGTGAAKGLFYGRKVYKGVVNNGTYVSRIQICRMSSSFEQWNYSGQILLSDNNSKPVLMTDSTLSNWNDWTTNTSGVWFQETQDFSVYKTSDYSPSSSTGRVFFNNTGTHWADNSSTNKGCAVYAWGGDASPRKWTTGNTVYSATVYHLTWFNDDNGMSYGYADIPLNASGYKFVRTTVADEYTTGLGYFSDNSFNIDSFAYVRFGLTSGNTINSGGAKNDVAGANLMKKVIEAYDTCSSSVLNGYGAWSALNTNFYSHATSAALSATQKSLNGSSTTIQAHFEGMASRVGRSGSSGSLLIGLVNKETQNIAIIVIISLVSVTAIGGYFFIRKRQEN